MKDKDMPRYNDLYVHTSGLRLRVISSRVPGARPDELLSWCEVVHDPTGKMKVGYRDGWALVLGHGWKKEAP